MTHQADNEIFTSVFLNIKPAPEKTPVMTQESFAII
jgi:hypothetical protein